MTNSKISQVSCPNSSLSFINKLIKGLEIILESIALTPVDNNKVPIRTGWQSEHALGKEHLKDIIRQVNGKCKGYGIRTGSNSNGILAIDCDGKGAKEYVETLLGYKMPETVSFTSGTPNKAQYLFQVDSDYWDLIQTQKIKLDGVYIQGEKEHSVMVEFRWEGCQSVLPPSMHPETGEYFYIKDFKECEIVALPVEVLNFLITKKLDSDRLDCDKEAIASGALPLYNFLSKNHREAIDKGAGEGSRSITAYNLACDLQGVVDKFASDDFGNIELTPDPRKYYDQFCQRCNPPYEDGDREWNSALKETRQPAMTDDYLTNIRNSYLGTSKFGKNGSSDNNSQNSKRSQFKFIASLDFDLIKDEYKQLLDSELNSATTREAYRITSFQKYGVRIDSFLREVETELERDEQLEARRIAYESQVKEIKTLQIFDLLPAEIAFPLSDFARASGIDEGVLISTLLATVSGVHKLGTTVRIGKVGQKFSEIPAINHAIVGISGSGKSIAVSNIVTNPLKPLKRAARDQYVIDKCLFDSCCEMAGIKEADRDSATELTVPKPKPANRYFATGGTMEGLKESLADSPDNSLILVYDEFASLISSFGQYKGGGGNDRQEFLSFHDGKGADDLKVKKNVYYDKSNVCFIGGLQPSVMKKYFTVGASDGLTARFTLSFMSKASDSLPELADEEPEDITPHLTNLYASIGTLPAKEYTILGESYKYFNEKYTEYRKMSSSLPEGYIQEFYGKCPGYLARIALNLHILNNYHNPSEDISKDTLELAATVVEYFIENTKKAEEILNGEKSDNIIQDIIKVSERRKSLGGDGWITVRDCVQALRKSHTLKSDEYRQLLQDMAKLKLVDSRGVGSKLEIKAK